MFFRLPCSLDKSKDGFQDRPQRNTSFAKSATSIAKSIPEFAFPEPLMHDLARSRTSSCSTEQYSRHVSKRLRLSVEVTVQTGPFEQMDAFHIRYTRHGVMPIGNHHSIKLIYLTKN